MRWPFAWKSTVELAQCGERAANRRALDWHDRLMKMQTRLTEITDLDRTTPEIMAQVFSSWDGDRQAKFFNAVGQLTRDWENDRGLQFAYIEPELDNEGREVLQELSRYTREP